VTPPLLVVVTGMPSSGKTTVAERLARELRLPLIAKDEIKESLYDSLGAEDVASSARLGAAAFALIFAFARAMLASGSRRSLCEAHAPPGSPGQREDQGASRPFRERRALAVAARGRAHRARHDAARRHRFARGTDSLRVDVIA